MYSNIEADWDNNTCDEVIFGYPQVPATHIGTIRAMSTGMQFLPQARFYLKDSKCKAGEHNVKYAASPSYDVDGTLYNYKLGMPIQNFRKYPAMNA